MNRLPLPSEKITSTTSLICGASNHDSHAEQIAQLRRLEMDLNACILKSKRRINMNAMHFSSAMPSAAMMLAQPANVAIVTVLSFLVTYSCMVMNLLDGKIQDMETEQRLQGAINRIRETLSAAGITEYNI